MPPGLRRPAASSMAVSLSGVAIAFDLDGTLVDTAPDLIGTLNGLLADHRLAPLAFAAARPLIGHGARAMIERGFQAAGAPLEAARLDDLFEQFLVRYVARIADESRPYPGCAEALDALKARGARLSVCTNKRSDLARMLLDAVGLSSRFEAIIGADAAPARKPDPRHLQTAIRAVGGDPARAIMVGDASPDAGAARAAGTGLILVSFGYTDTPAHALGPDALIDHFDDLPDACDRLLGACEPQAEPL